jgi:hypothetical protein
MNFILGSINSEYYEQFGRFVRQFPKNNIKIALVILALFCDGVNYFYYRKRYKMLIEKYKNHHLNNTFKVWYLYFVAAGLLVFPFILHRILMIFV